MSKWQPPLDGKTLQRTGHTLLLLVLLLCAITGKLQIPTVLASGDDRGSRWKIVDTSNLSPYGREGHAWRTFVADMQTARLTYNLDLHYLSGATLNFETAYAIEKGWDFGFVQISIDNGRTWASMTDRQGRTTSDHQDEALEEVINNLPGFTGSSNGWVQETFDLSAYVGKVVAISFLYITDWRIQGRGWMIDNVVIPEMNFLDDAEHGPLVGVDVFGPISPVTMQQASVSTTPGQTSSETSIGQLSSSATLIQAKPTTDDLLMAFLGVAIGATSSVMSIVLYSRRKRRDRYGYFLKRLEELRSSGRITDEVYLKLKKEWSDKSRRLVPDDLT